MNERAPLNVASLSHPGMVRAHNEDSVFVDGEAGLAVLADGMGGYSAGEVASGIAVNVVSTGLMPELRSGRELVEDRRAKRAYACRAAAVAADRLGEQGHLRGRAGPRRMRRHGHDDRRRGVPREPRVDRPYRRLALLPAARREVRAAHARPLAAAGADRQRAADGGAGALLAEQEPGHARARHRGDRSRRHRRVPARGERHLPPVLGRPDRHGRSGDRAFDRRRQARGAAAGRRGARRPREHERRPRQHLGDPGARPGRLPADVRMGAALPRKRKSA